MSAGRLAAPVNVASLSLKVVVAGLMANISYNLVMASLGAEYPYTGFLFAPSDRWADFFKLVFSLPGPSVKDPTISWSIQPYVDYLRRMAEMYTGPLNPDHMPPLPTLLAVLARRAFGILDPILVFAVLMSAGLFAVAIMMARLARDRDQTSSWAAVAILSYPVIFMADRGHFFSLICALTLIIASWRVLMKSRFTTLDLLLFAIAVNLRPNVGIVPLLIVATGRAGTIKDLALLATVSIILLLLAMAAASALYPHYGWHSWIAGMQDYRHNYIEQPQSFGFQTSLPLVGELAGLPSGVSLILCLSIGCLVGIATLMLGRIGRLSDSALIFLAVALMPLVVPAFADYHLIPLLLPLLLLAREGGPKTARDMVVLAATLIILIPKNYLYGDDNYYTAWSYQIVMNPIMLLVAVWSVIVMSWRGIIRLDSVSIAAEQDRKRSVTPGSGSR